MNASAYLVAHFRITEGKPCFLGTAIYSEGGNSVTSAIRPGRFACTVIEVPGKDYAEAYERLLALRDDAGIKLVFGWAFDALHERG